MPMNDSFQGCWFRERRGNPEFASNIRCSPDPDVVHPEREITYHFGQGVGVPDIEALAPARSGTGEQLLGAEER